MELAAVDDIQPSPEPPDAPGSFMRSASPPWFHLTRVALILLVVMVALSITLCLLMRQVVQDEERRTLHDRSNELTLLLNQSLQSTALLLPLAASSAAEDRASSASFVSITNRLVRGGNASVFVTEAKADTTGAFPVVAKAGKPAVPSAITGAQADALQRAAKSQGLITELIPDGANRQLMVAQRASGLLVAEISPLRPPTPTRAPPGTAFSDLNVAVYASDTADPKSLLLVYGGMPTGMLEQQHLAVGTGRWLVVTSPAGELVASVAEWTPWVALAVGLALAALLTILVEGLARRRRYALALVEERTASLQKALEDGRRLQLAEERARRDAEAANRSKSEFISRMSHELRTPLNAVIGFGQLLERDELEQDQRDSVGHILKGGYHLLQLINEVLDIARIETGDLAFSPEAVRLSELVADTVGLVRPLAHDGGINLVSSKPIDDHQYVFADRQRLQQILLNLLSNAIKYNRRGGSVAISYERSGPSRLRIDVADTGPGIPQEQLGRLFTAFDRLGAERGTIEGTGIGLALSRQLAEAMGGTIGVQTVVGRGSTFSVELPSAEGPVERYDRLNGAATRPAKANEKAATGTAMPERRTLLYIEDNLANLNLIERILAERDVELIPAMQGRLGLELAKEHRPFVVLLDLHLPDIDGDEVLQRLRDDPITASTPVVIISADASPGKVQRLMSAGALSFLTKPIDVDHLLGIIDEQLARSESSTPTDSE